MTMILLAKKLIKGIDDTNHTQKGKKMDTDEIKVAAIRAVEKVQGAPGEQNGR